MSFNSGDFDKTTALFSTIIPARLIHKDVTGSGQRSEFSAERKHGVAVVDLPSKTISVTVGHLTPNQSTNKHRHTYETILYILQGNGYSIIEDQRIDWTKGDAVYVPSWAWHQHVNLSNDQDAEYLACENTPLLQNLGALAIREEAK